MAARPSQSRPAPTPRPARRHRWQRGSLVDALYLAEDEACAWAEWYRHLAEAAIPSASALPRDLWRYEVTALEVADLSDAARLARVGPSACPDREDRDGSPIKPLVNNSTATAGVA